jgi:hypothetical protein
LHQARRPARQRGDFEIVSTNRPVDLLDRPYCLEDQWWVLDNTLRIHKELGGKKGREVLLLRELKLAYPAYPEGPVFATETPDFLVEDTGERTVGLELLEVHRGGARRRGSRHRERQEVEEAVLRQAEKIYYAADPPGTVYVHLSWPADPEAERLGPLPRPTAELAGEVARLVREGAPAWIGGGWLELGPRELEGTILKGVLYSISAHLTGFVGDDGRGSPWGRTSSYAPAIATVADLAREIAAKDRVYAGCKEKCREAWLVAALTGGPASFDDADETVLDHVFESAFDKLMLLCPGSRFARRAATLSVTR